MNLCTEDDSHSNDRTHIDDGCRGRSAFKGQAPFRENVVSLSAHLDVRSLNYTPLKPDVSTILFETIIPPIRAIVSISNNTNQRLDVGTAQRNWAEALSFSVYRRTESRIEDVSGKVMIRSLSRETQPRTMTVGPGKHDSLPFLVEPDEAATFVA